MITQLRSIPQLRMCASVTGEANLVFTIYSRTLDGVARIQLELGQRLPDLQPLETMVHLRSHKRMGWLIGPDGRCTGKVVAPNLFSPT
jgi:Lrp/AsnC ligand binding domain